MRIPLLDRLVWKEMAGPWVFGVAMFSVVLMAGTYLFRLTDYLVKGIDPTDIIRLSGLYMPGLVAKTFPMAVLLSALLAFARLSNDSEIIAAQAGGASLFRLMRPVAFFGLAVSLLAFVFGEYIVPPASIRAQELQMDVIKQLKQTSSQPYSQTLYVKGVFKGQLSARDLNIGSNTMRGVSVVWWGTRDEPDLYFYFRELYYVPGQQWFARDGYALSIDEKGNIKRLILRDAKPPFGEALDFTPQAILTSQVTDYDALSMSQLKTRIAKLRTNPKRDPDSFRQERDLQVGFWTKISLPLSGLIFALVGAPVSIRRVRQSVGVGVGISIMVIFVYYLIHNYMTILAKGGRVDPALSAFLPVVIGLAAAVGLLLKKNA